MAYSKQTFTVGQVLTAAQQNQIETNIADHVHGVSNVSGGTWELISSQTASASATLDFTSGIGATYPAYKFVLVNLVPATDNVILEMRTSTDAGSSFDSTVGDYDYATVFLVAGAALTESDNDNTSFVALANTVGNATGEGVSGEVTLWGPSNASRFTKITAMTGRIDSTGAFGFQIGGGARMAAGDVDAVRFFMSSGNITSGTIYMYGLRG